LWVVAQRNGHLTHFFTHKKSPKNGGGKNTPPLFLGTLGVENYRFGGDFLSFLRLKCFQGKFQVGFKEKNSAIFPFQFGWSTFQFYLENESE
jgi:hypothetical protein